MTAQTDATFLRQFLLVLGALVLFTVIILIAASTITSSVDEARGEDPRLRAAIVDRIKPIGTVNIAGAPAASTETAAAPERSGEQVAAVACNACHLAGVLGAPKTGDGNAWSQRLTAAGGVDGLTTSAINGKGKMPARGGAQVSDAEIRSAIEYMLAESGVEVAEGGSGDAPSEPPAATGAAATQAGPASAAATTPAAEPSPPAASAPPQTAVQPPAAAAVATAPPDAPATPGAAPAAEPPPAAQTTAASGPDLAKGKAVYDSACFACHATGVGGAPKLGDKALWGPRIAKGRDTLNTSALNGIGIMPPKGGRMDLADADIIAAVAFMVEQSK